MFDRVVEDFSRGKRYSQRLESLEEASRAFLRDFTHGVERLLEANNVALDV